jgi:putative FmdB family regulatory protein
LRTGTSPVEPAKPGD